VIRKCLVSSECHASEGRPAAPAAVVKSTPRRSAPKKIKSRLFTEGPRVEEHTCATDGPPAGLRRALPPGWRRVRSRQRGAGNFRGETLRLTRSGALSRARFAPTPATLPRPAHAPTRANVPRRRRAYSCVYALFAAPNLVENRPRACPFEANHHTDLGERARWLPTLPWR
jgi:hypothetical protein